MKTVTTLGVVALSTTAVLLGSVGQAAAADAFTGTWFSTDTDGSTQTLTVRGTGHWHAVTYYDDVATQACDGAAATITGRGAVDGDTMVLSGNLRCGAGTSPLRHVTVGFEHRADDTLLDQFGITWTRT